MQPLKNFWSSVSGRQKSHNSVEINGVQLNADLINKFFADIATDPHYDAGQISSYRIGGDVSYTFIGDDAIHDYQIEPVLRHLKNTAPGLDNLPSWLFRACSYELAGVIADLLNLSFSSGRVPETYLQ